MAAATKISFPGIRNPIGFTFSIGHGETPGVCQLSISPQAEPPALIGDLVIEYDGRVYTWPQCRIVSASYRRDSSGQIVGLNIEDWRWKWRTGTISGRYNRRESFTRSMSTAAAIVSHTEKSPRELFKLCFEALGQTVYNVDQVPDEPRPEIDWDGDLAAQAMASLCDVLGCRIVPLPGNGVAVQLAGEGAFLPRLASMTDYSETLDPPEKPDGALVRGGPVERQCDFELEALAEETDGEFVPLDEVSYKPTGGWENDSTTEFLSIPLYKNRKLAQGSVRRAWRIKIPAGGLYITGYTDITGKRVNRLDQLIVLERQCETTVQAGREVFRPAWVYGAFIGDNTVGDNVYSNTITTPEPIVDPDSELAKKCIYQGGVSYDQERGILFTADQLMLIDDTKRTVQPAKLRYRVAVAVRDEETEALYRYTRERSYGTQTGTKPYEIRRDEIVSRSIPTYDKFFNVTAVDFYQTAADREADYYLDLKEQEWNKLAPSEATYTGIVPLLLDGAIQHVVYSGGNNGPSTTRVSRNNELKLYITPYKERRQREALKGASLLSGGVQSILAAARRLAGRRG